MKIKCHCNNIEITVRQLPEQLTECNCSICRRYNSLWAYYLPEQVKIEIGDKGSTSYSWNDKCIEFVFCNRCACVTHYQTLPNDPSPRIAVNFRMAKLQEIEGIKLRLFNGAEM